MNKREERERERTCEIAANVKARINRENFWFVCSLVTVEWGESVEENEYFAFYSSEVWKMIDQTS